MALYIRWVRLFESFCDRNGLDSDAQLTLASATTFADAYAAQQQIVLKCAASSARSALHAWRCARHALGYVVPDWQAEKAPPVLDPLLTEFAEFRRRHGGVAEATVKVEADVLSAFLAGLAQAKRLPTELQLTDVDQFVVACAERWSHKTVARACCVVRAFLRFMHGTGRLAHDLASSVASPFMRSADRPPHALPWPDVQRLLTGIDVTRRTGRRDYALLLMMASYGMGAAEILHLRLEDIDWRASVLRVVRPKTGVETSLPLLPGIGEALVAYLQDGRPRHATTRSVFVSAVAPHGPMTAAAVRFAVGSHAHAAGVTGPMLGSHVLRHSHACRQIDLDAPAKVVGDILGHRDPSSTSAYIRIATTRLRALALPVPQ